MLMKSRTSVLPQPSVPESGSGYNTPQRAQMGVGLPAPGYQLLNRASAGAVGPPLGQGRQSFSLPSGTLPNPKTLTLNPIAFDACCAVLGLVYIPV